MMPILWARQAKSFARRHTAREWWGWDQERRSKHRHVSSPTGGEWGGQDGAEPFPGGEPTACPDLAQDPRGEPWTHVHGRPQESMQAVLGGSSGMHPSTFVLRPVGGGVPIKHQNLSPRDQWG